MPLPSHLSQSLAANGGRVETSAEPRQGTSAATAAIERWLGWFCAVALLLLMAVTAVDVVGRYIFNAPVRGAYQIVTALMALMVMAGLPIVTLREEHIKAGLFDQFFDGPIRRLHRPAIDAVCGIALAVFAWRLWLQAADFSRTGQVLDYTLQIPTAPIIYFVAAMATVATLLQLLLFGQRLRAGR